MIASADPADKVRKIIDLQIEFTAAEENMKKAWLIYRDRRPDAAALDAYTSAVEHCQRLKEDIFTIRTAGRFK
jgi:hypothetical protein